jgi:hypothetical protein
MTRELTARKAADNTYLHRDFHGALSAGIEYLHEQFGPAAVRDYLRQFATAFYAPLTAALDNRGLAALEEHFGRIYRIEGGRVEMRCSADELVIEVDACPAVTHMRANDYPVARLFSETTRTVNQAICEGTPFAAELVDYDEATGRRVERFYRREP